MPDTNGYAIRADSDNLSRWDAIRNSIELAKSSWEVLKADKELLALPVISGIASIIAAATFIIPLFATTDLDEGTMSATGYAWLFLMYVVLAYITIFFNAALVSAGT